jgi:hypothetical protein
MSNVGSVLAPVLQPAGVVTDVRVAEAAQQADRLLTERSRRTAAIRDDVGAPVGQQLWSAPGDVVHRQIDRTGDVHCRERFRSQDIDEHDPVAAQRADELTARDRLGSEGGHRS